MEDKFIGARIGQRLNDLKPKMKNGAAGKLVTATPLDWMR